MKPASDRDVSPARSSIRDMSLEKAALMSALTVEQYTNPWWTTRREDVASSDDDVTTARRRRDMAADFGAIRPTEEAS